MCLKCSSNSCCVDYEYAWPTVRSFVDGRKRRHHTYHHTVVVGRCQLLNSCLSVIIWLGILLYGRKHRRSKYRKLHEVACCRHEAPISGVSRPSPSLDFSRFPITLNAASVREWCVHQGPLPIVAFCRIFRSLMTARKSLMISKSVL